MNTLTEKIQSEIDRLGFDCKSVGPCEAILVVFEKGKFRIYDDQADAKINPQQARLLLKKLQRRKEITSEELWGILGAAERQPAKKHVSIEFKADFLEIVRNEAKKRGLGFSEFVRESLAKEIGRE